jgi:hypothetical protein
VNKDEEVIEIIEITDDESEVELIETTPKPVALQKPEPTEKAAVQIVQQKKLGFFERFYNLRLRGRKTFQEKW